MSEITLYASPFTCSLTVRFALAQHAVPHQVRWVKRGPGREIQTADYAQINPKLKVPTLVLGDGEVLTENASVLFYIDETHGPARSPAQRRQLLSWLVYLGTELHMQILAPTYNPETDPDALIDVRERLLPPVLTHLEQTLDDRQTLLGGEVPSPADAYLVWALLLIRNQWAETLNTPAIQRYLGQMLTHEYVQTTLAEEQAARVSEG